QPRRARAEAAARRPRWRYSPAVPPRVGAPGAGPRHRRPEKPADGPRPGEPPVDAPLRRRPGRDAGRLRPARRPADAPRVTRRARGRAGHLRLVDETDTSSYRPQRDLPPGERRSPRLPRGGPRERSPVALPAAAPRPGGAARRAAGRRRAAG